MISILKTFLLHIFNVNIQYFNLKKQIIEYSAEDSDYSFLFFLEKSIAIIPNIRPMNIISKLNP